MPYHTHVTVHVGEALLKDTALLLPNVLTFFRQNLKEVTQQCNIESDIVDTITPTWLRSQLSSILQPHMAYQCSVKKCGTVLYRYGGDLLHALNVALGQVRNLTQMCSGDVQSTEDNVPCNLSEMCISLNNKFHACIKRMLEQDECTVHRLEDINIDSFIQDLDVWKAICLLTQPLSSNAKRGTEFSNHLRKVRRCFCLCVLFFSINSQYSFLMHTLITDAIETCGGSSRLQKLLNRLGACASIDTHSRSIQSAKENGRGTNGFLSIMFVYDNIC